MSLLGNFVTRRRRCVNKKLWISGVSSPTPVYKLFLFFYQDGGLLVATVRPERVAYARAGETLARLPRMTLGKISLARGIYCCPIIVYSFAPPASLCCKEYMYIYIYIYIYIYYCYDYVLSLYVYVWLPWLRFFRAFFLSCKTNARLKPAKTGHGPHSS